jgi:methanogenic corrinoid protein MtbC1
MSELGDFVIAPAFESIGHRWEEGEVAVYQERRALEITRNLLHELRLAQRPPGSDAPRALGGAIAGDNYALAAILVELVLRELGWQARYFGSNLPIESLVNMLQNERPRLFWLSLSHLEDEGQFVADFRRLQAATGRNTAIVVGGRALHAELRQQITYFAFCETLEHLETLAETLETANGTQRRAADT